MRLIRKLVRKILQCRHDETIIDALSRHKSKIKKIIYRGRIIEKDELEEALRACGVSENDNLMVHASWREFFNYNGTPASVIDSLLEIIGTSGTLVMPCYGKNEKWFDVDNDVSNAGVLSEYFRTHYNVIRSKGSHFSCAAIGKYAGTVTCDHEKSIYGFDEYSPYAKFVRLDNSKVIMLGLGKNSVKLSLYHLPEMIMKEKDPFYKGLFKETYISHVVYQSDGKRVEKRHTMLQRQSTQPNQRNIRKIYKQNFSIYKRIKNLDIVVIDATRALQYILSEAEKGNYMIRLHW